MEVYVKETLHVLDYNENIKQTIFNSDDHMTAGYAYNITITEANTGYSDLKFEMPNVIINDKGESIKNPFLSLLVPLVKLRYHRQVYYVGEKPITVREPVGYGDTTTYVDRTYSNVYPENIIEDYVMDYIVQPIDKKRDVLKISTSFTAMDYPRFNLSKKRVGLTISQDTLTKDEWTLFENKPLDKPGTIKYTQWNSDLSQTAGKPDIPLEWDPEHAVEYPLGKEQIRTLMQTASVWPYGLLASAFYWPITSTARFQGVLYKEGGYLVLQLYDFYDQTTTGIDPNLYIDRYSWDWTQLYKVDSYLCPNNALNYLYHILEGTNWSVALRQDNTPDVDIVKTVVHNPKDAVESTEWVDLQSNINISSGNCYNAITALCKELQVYPVFDCINRTVALRQFSGKNYGLVYALGNNIKDNTIKNDGERVITKLYCTGGKDYDGDANINIGTATRDYTKNFTGFYNNVNSLPTTEIEGYYAIVDNSIPNSAFRKPEYIYQEVDGKMAIVKTYSSTEYIHDLSVPEYWNAGPNRQVYYWDGNNWNLATKLDTGLWAFIINGNTVIVDPITGTTGEWTPNDDMYITGRSPYGTNYILNLWWSYKNNWITKEQILELYQYEQQINDLNLAFADKYIKDYREARQIYNTAVNEYDIAQDGFESTLHKMENKYYNVDLKYSEGYTYAFHKPPKDTYQAYNRDLGKNTYYIKLFHCYNPDCRETRGLEPEGANAPADLAACPVCGGTDVSNEAIYIPTFKDYTFTYDHDIYPYTTDMTKYNEKSYAYSPHLKGDYLSMIISMDKLDNTQQNVWTIGDYEQAISLIKEIPFKEPTVVTLDGYDYKLNGVYVRSTSGKIEVWNDDISNYLTNYGKMLDDLRSVLTAQQRIKELDELYDSWKEQTDGLHAIIQENFGDYLIEGNYINDEQPYIGLLFNEGKEASDKFSIPEITYSLNVVDSSGLVEYREPTITRYHCNECDYISYDEISTCPRCGNDIIIVEHDVYNDLVKMLHSVGQIIPKAGDYVTVYDEPMGMYGVPALITQITRYLDNPINNKIDLNTSYTDDEELVGNIITATNTVLNNADIYARTAILRSDGTIDPNSITESLNNNTNNIAIVGTNGNMLLDSTGMRVTNSTNPHKAMKYSGNGIYYTNNFSTDSNEAVIWERILSDEGINANYIRSGSIDTNRLTILSGQYGKVMLDQYGLSVKNDSSTLSHVTAFDKNAAKNNVNYGKTWSTNNNIASFIGVDTNNDPLIYTKGFLVAEEGSNIANWITANEGFYHLNGQSQKDLWLSPTGLKRSNYKSNATLGNSDDPNFAIYINDQFGVTTSGKLYAKGIDISVSGLSLDSNITIPTINLPGTILYRGDVSHTRTYVYAADGTHVGYKDEASFVDATGTTQTYTTYTSKTGDGYVYTNVGLGTQNSTHTSNYVQISTDGLLKADNALIYGTIYAGAGQIGGWTIAQNGLYYNNTSNPTLYLGTAGIAGSIGGTNRTNLVFKAGDNFGVTNGGALYSSSGQIGKWDIHDDYLGSLASSQSSSSAANNYFLSQSGKYAYCSMNGSNQDNFFIFLKDKFAVTTAGKLYAQGVEIKGKVTATSGTFTGRIEADEGYFKGNISGATGTFTGGINTTNVHLGYWYLDSQNLACVASYGGVIFTGDYLKYAGALGNANALWHDIAAANGSDRRLKEHIHTLDNNVEKFFDALQPVSYHFKSSYDLHPEKLRFGFIAQDVLEASNNSLDEEIGAININTGNNMYDLNKQDFIALNTWQIQKLKQQVKELQQAIEQIKKEKAN